MISSDMKVISAHANSRGITHRRRTVVMIVVALAFIINLLDVTVVNIAIPSIQRELGASYSEIQWVISAYLLTFGTLLITGGRLGDLFGYKKLFMIGVAGFTLASLLSGLSPNAATLIIARLIQGTFAALMVPQVLSLMQVLYQPHERAGISGIFGMLGGLSATAGPIIGGLLISANIFGSDWRPIFLINIPVGIFALAMGQKLLPAGGSTHPPKHIDYPGSALIVASLGLIIYALVEGQSYGWPWWIYVLIAGGLVLLAAFIYDEVKRFKKGFSTLLVPPLFKSRTFSAGLGVMFFFSMTMLGFFFTFTLILQIGFGFSALKAALVGIPTAIGIAFSSGVLGPRLLKAIGARVMSLGALLIGGGVVLVTWALAHYSASVTWYQLLPGLVIFGLGMGMLFAAIFAVLYNDIDPRFAGAASGLQNTFQQIAGAIGVAVIGTVFFGAISGHAVTSFAQVAPQLKSQLVAEHLPPPAASAVISKVKQCFHDRAASSDPSATSKSCQQPASNSPAERKIASEIASAASSANADNFSRAFKLATIYELAILLAAFILSFLLPRHLKHPDVPPEIV